MNENINLCEFLEGHEGETFYSPICGEIRFIEINLANINPIVTNRFNLRNNGKWDNSGEIMIFPSKDQRDWNKWAEEQKHNFPKTWSELITADIVKYTKAVTCNTYNDYGEIIDDSITGQDTSVEKSALALLKIHQLIEAGYGGNVIEDVYSAWTIDPHSFNPVINKFGYRHLLFHSKEQAKEFLSYPENIQLLKDFYMI